MTLMEKKVRQYKENAAGLAGILPQVANAYESFTGRCLEDGELDAKTKQLVALGVALFANNEVCTYYHVQAARDLGASDLQIMETVAVASAVASGHVLSQGVIRVQGALQGEQNAASNGNLQFNAFQDTEFAEEEPEAPGMSIPGGNAVSPSY
ncbi:carboxymuconolactone decarboxylase family protein [Cohnella luojiensis]|uniref:Carboxymuconolactone decarboxylase family protein n=1 Tax=Cohnella luojiensis TaxID=652876 RepID=A0A4Y8M5P4_9BACL|nr:carboxymuconolactone decarboxylase family protein [Cohnella luojiensis]